MSSGPPTAQPILPRDRASPPLPKRNSGGAGAPSIHGASQAQEHVHLAGAQPGRQPPPGEYNAHHSAVADNLVADLPVGQVLLVEEGQRHGSGLAPWVDVVHPVDLDLEAGLPDFRGSIGFTGGLKP